MRVLRDARLSFVSTGVHESERGQTLLEERHVAIAKKIGG